MKKEKKIKDHISPFLEKLKRERKAPSTIKKKRQNLEAFTAWLEKEGLKDIRPSEFEKKHLLKFKRNLFSKGLKETTVSLYLKSIEDLLKYSENGEKTTRAVTREKESDIQSVVNHYFKTKGYSLKGIKENARKRKIIYSRYTRPAKDLLELAGSVEKAKAAISKVALWANSRNLDYAIETVFKKWPEINRLKPKKKVKKPYFHGDPMVWSESKKKWFVINRHGDWLEFAGKEEEIEWKNDQ